LRVPACRGSVQRRILHAVRGTRVDGRAEIEQGTREISLAEECCEMQERPAIGAARLEKRRVAIDLVENIGSAAGYAGSEDVELRAAAKQKCCNGLLPVIFREQKCCLAGLIGRIEQRRILGEARSYGIEVAALHLFMKGFEIWHVRPPGRRVDRFY
jgi:hypothetical protein